MAAQGSGRSALARWALFCASVLGALVLAELYARHALANTRARIYRIDERRIWAPLPDTEKVFVRPRPGQEPLAITLRLNHLGYRGPDPQPGTSARRVVVYGDSYVEARYVPLEESFPRAIERALERAGKHVLVHNAGVTGYGPDQSFLRLDEELERLQPELVVFTVFAGNDFGDLLRNKLFRLTDGALLPNTAILTEELRRSFAAPRELALLELLGAGADEPALAVYEPMDSARVQRILETALAASASEYEEFVLRGDDVVRNPFLDRYDADLSLEPERDSARYKSQLMAAILHAVAERVHSGGAQLLLVFVPHLLDVCPPDIAIDRARFPLYSPSAKTDLLCAIAERERAPFLDLFGPFRKACAQELYFRVDDHWNATGQALAAELCARTILERGLLP